MRSLVIANWKMNPSTFKEAKKLLDATKKAAEKAKVSVVVAPPSIFLRDLAAKSRGKRISFAGQHAHAETDGAHTGDISMRQLQDAKARYVLIGHAERRAQGETNEDTKKKVASALATGLIPILCVGETKRTVSGEYFNLIAQQLKIALAEVSAARLPKIVIVYEPIWAIGKEAAMNPRDMHEMAIFIRKTLVDAYGEHGHNTTILYGGSVDAASAPSMIKDGDVHGLLVGRASWRAVEFAHLLQAVGNA